MTPEDAKCLKMEPFTGEKKWTSATGHPVKVYGVVKPLVRFADGRTCRMPFNVMDVKRTLASVGEIEDKGNDVQMSKHAGSGIWMSDYTWKPMTKRRGVYTLPIWIYREKDGADPRHPNEGQPRA